MIPHGWVLPSVTGSGAQASLLRALRARIEALTCAPALLGAGGVSTAAAEAQGRRLRQTDRLG
jgi:hypothetical protein